MDLSTSIVRWVRATPALLMLKLWFAEDVELRDSPCRSWEDSSCEDGEWESNRADAWYDPPIDAPRGAGFVSTGVDVARAKRGGGR